MHCNAFHTKPPAASQHTVILLIPRRAFFVVARGNSSNHTLPQDVTCHTTRRDKITGLVSSVKQKG